MTGINALEVCLTGDVVSFRDPMYSGLVDGTPTLPCPPPSTMGGIFAAAAGGWDHVDPQLRFAAAFSATGHGTDLETWHPIGKSRMDPQPRERKFLSGATLRLWIVDDVDTWWNRFRRPVWGLRLGRSQDLVGIQLTHVQLTRAVEARQGHGIVPYTGGGGTRFRLATAVSIGHADTRWDDYVHAAAGSTTLITTDFATTDGEAVVLLPPTHPVHAQR